MTTEAAVAEGVDGVLERWPTTESAYGCIDCGAIFRALDDGRCPHCKSQSCFDVAAMINRPGVSVERLRPIVEALDAELDAESALVSEDGRT